MGFDPAATMAYDHRDRQATVAAFSASGENARRYACDEIDDTDYTRRRRNPRRATASAMWCAK
jgi:hypothetical protein